MVTIIVLSGCSQLSSHPTYSPLSLGVFQPSRWHVKETVSCPQGYQCYSDIWVPQVNVYRDMWVFGVSNNEEKGGILHFRPLPDHPCTTHCVEDCPISHRAEVISVPHTGGNYSHEEVPLTFIPKGRYVVTSPSFSMHYNMKLWIFVDDGTGPQDMSAVLDTDRETYGGECNTVLLKLQITDKNSNEFIRVDSLYGTISVPDSTQKTLFTDEWSWNELNRRYEYLWNFENDAGELCDPKEGYYSAEVWVKKKYYADERASTDFSVCYHMNIDFTFDHAPPVYELGDLVEMTVTCYDRSGQPIAGTLDITLVQPDGQSAEANWVYTDGVYTVQYHPTQEGLYSVTISVKDDVICYLEEAHGQFLVSHCKEAVSDITLSEPIVNELIQAELNITDSEGNPLTGANVSSTLHTPSGSLTLSWEESDEGIYRAQFTPTETGFYQICGHFYVMHDSCYQGFFEAGCTVTEKLLPDLLITNEDISVDPEPEIGDTVTISVTVHNIGNKDAQDFWVIILINDVPKYWELIPYLPPGGSYTLEYQWIVIFSGGYVIQAIVDPPEGVI